MNTLIVRLDGIGDYILFRNILRFIRKSAKYKNRRITILGNSAWRDLALKFDGDCADEWIWVDKPNTLGRLSIENLLPSCIYNSRIKSRQRALHDKLCTMGFDEVIIPQLHRPIHLEWLVSGVAPIIQKGWELDPNENEFDFIRNKHLGFLLTGDHCNVNMSLDIQDRGSNKKNEQKYIIIFASASHWTKCWPYYTRLASEIRELYQVDVHIEGLKRVNHQSLSDFAKKISQASLVVTNDTMALHLSAALDVPVLGITNGIEGHNSYWPYPASLGKKVDVIIPKTQKSNLVGPLGLFLTQMYKYRALSSISVSDVMKKLTHLL